MLATLARRAVGGPTGRTAAAALAAHPNVLSDFSKSRFYSTAEEMMSRTYAGKDFWIESKAPVLEAIKKMAELHVGCLIVADGDKVVGLLSERDYLKKVEVEGKTAANTEVHQIMTLADGMVTARPTDNAEICLARMLRQDIRHLPVAEKDGKVVGMLSIRDVAKEVSEEQEEKVELLVSYYRGY